MSTEFLYIAKQYFKNFLIVALGLTFAATLIDFIEHVGHLQGANRKFLYFYYIYCDYLVFIYPIALVFGAIITFFNLLWRNHLVAFLSFGYRKSRLIKPFFAVFIVVYTLIVALSFTKFAYYGDSARALIENRQLFKSLDNIFFKYNNNFVFAKKMDVVNKEFSDVTLYTTKNNRLVELSHFKKAKFKNKKWIAIDIEKKIIQYNKGKPEGYKVEHIDRETILKGYYPKVVRLLYEGKRMSIKDAIRALKLLKEQGIDNSKVKSALYTKVIMPLFAPILIIIIFAMLPIHRRFVSRAKYLLLTMGTTLVIWTLLYSVNMLTINGTIPADLGQPLVIFVLFIISLLVWKKKAESF